MDTKILIKQQKFNIALLAIIYLLSVFINWSFYLPFKWILDIPTWSNSARGIFLFMLALYVTIQFLIYKTIKNNNDEYVIPLLSLIVMFICFLSLILI